RALDPQIFGRQRKRRAVLERDRQALSILAQADLRRPGRAGGLRRHAAPKPFAFRRHGLHIGGGRNSRNRPRSARQSTVAWEVWSTAWSSNGPHRFIPPPWSTRSGGQSAICACR